jgi:hypothetical protein
VIRNDSSLRYQFKHGLKELRRRAREVLAGAQPERRPDISETTVSDNSDDSVRVDGDVPAAPGPDQVIPLVMHQQPWLQLPGQPAECPRENDDAVSECEDMASGLSSEDMVSGLSSQVKQSLAYREPQKEDKSEVLQRLMAGKRTHGAGEYKI